MVIDPTEESDREVPEPEDAITLNIEEVKVEYRTDPQSKGEIKHTLRISESANVGFLKLEMEHLSGKKEENFCLMHGNDILQTDGKTLKKKGVKDGDRILLCY